MLRQQHKGGGLSDTEGWPAACGARAVRRLGSGKAAFALVLQLRGTALTRGAPVVVLRRRVRAHGFGRARLQTEPPARRSVLPLHPCARSGDTARDMPGGEG